jgi:DNA repair protein RadC
MTYEIIYTQEVENGINITSSIDVYKFVKESLDIKKNQVILLTLNDLHRIIGSYIIHVGKLKSETIDHHMIFYKTLLDKSSTIVICYVTDSGILEPSPRIYKIASSLFDAAKILGINILYQLILSENGISRITRDINDE